MKLQINTQDKTLKLEESVKLGEFAEILNKLFPKNEWKEYKLETNTVINNWSNPIIIDRWTYPTYPWWNNPYYYTTGEFQITNNVSNADFDVNTVIETIYNVQY